MSTINASEDGAEPLGEAPEITGAAVGRPRARRRAGSLDDRQVEVINADETVLTVLVYPDGKVRFRSNQPREWVAETLQTLADSLRSQGQEGA
ncbi:hypothetical protein SEA_NECROPOLIS_51 [Mycobacterium phage Necropolis]|uniref:Uncharacterized protein n=5 Tax=Caudoviricetes TaxID=2731619 RepID=A0A143FPS3_9CAUD|nr:hypothetical protein MALITHI_52 [Mycobacterium phage Malithi]YP_009303814.1 hypothetical protein SEA_SHIPWRECK_56 [Mycobacterium phage Shipwreck]YP_009604835.1 hypothetical protein FDH94_gp52 [Mycobacterium phage Jebeks]YP_009964702.1 hypothetical protein I5J44_gp54 [Mycobacterium phage Phineas]ASD53683.1 hypothetical protein SEA_BOGIE_56 [Mycobacterium phage Bogie]QDH85010.1 hypothetical protein SEA_HUHILLTOP_54 [Mycobacterium phage HUHilltop]QDH92932.1 hypothetical protein SEA_NECROPOLIS